ncbi:ABC transporter permease [Sporosarcina sp. HYO08]|uniref:ABC transporter permease n=1 Tax=Sporosarcina sp. HYO08 TaxID=1759557 RepID=UPI0007923D5D|nr:ABC transporter permease subunit [Sporosarcina sp. HYO08]KXH83774.1 ABC transporter permease [Sporosarcina sp. HYO08]
MNGLGVLLLKEWREMVRSFKLLWIPLVFIFFGILEPITNYYLPEIMKTVGNLPEGAEFTWPELQGKDIFVSLSGQYQFIGILMIVLAFMGTIAGERKSGTATLLYVRPLSFTSYFFSKWLVINAVLVASVWLGFSANWYYVHILYDAVEPKQALAFIMTYSLWIVFATTTVLMFSAWLPTGGTAFAGIFLLVFYPFIDTTIGAYWKVSPWKLPTYASDWFDPTLDRSHLWMSGGVTLLLIVLFIVFGIWMSKRNAAKTTV